MTKKPNPFTMKAMATIEKSEVQRSLEFGKEKKKLKPFGMSTAKSSSNTVSPCRSKTPKRLKHLSTGRTERSRSSFQTLTMGVRYRVSWSYSQAFGLGHGSFEGEVVRSDGPFFTLLSGDNIHLWSSTNIVDSIEEL